MSEETEEKPFAIEIAKQGRAVCKRCGKKCCQGELRITKYIPYISSGAGKLKAWHHVSCIFESFLKQRPTTKRIESPQDIEGWNLLSKDNQIDILKRINDCNKYLEAKYHSKNEKKQKTLSGKLKITNLDPVQVKDKNAANEDSLSIASDICTHQDHLFREFRVVVADVMKTKNQNDKTKVLSKLFKIGSDGNGFKGDAFLWVKLLLPGLYKRTFNLQTKQLTKIFSKILHVSQDSMLENLEQQDIGSTIQYFFEHNKILKPAQKSTITLQEVDEYLEKLSRSHKEEEQTSILEMVTKKCTANDLKVFIRLVVHNLRMKAGVKNVLEAVSADLYQSYLICKDLNTILEIWKQGNIEMYLLDNSQNIKKNTDLDTKSEENKRSPKRKLPNDSPNHKKKKNDISPIIQEPEQEPVVENVISEFQTEDNNTIDIKESSNYFENIKLLLEDGIEERCGETIKSFTDYGGVIVSSHDWMNATHVLHLRDTISEQTIKCKTNARHVIIEWIKHSISEQSLQDFRPYTVRWNPDLKKY